MGFEDRDYYRGEGQSGFFAPAGSAIKWLLAVNIAVFLLQILTTQGGSSALDRWLAFRPEAVLHGEVWRLVTYGLGYGGNPLVFLFDMYFLWVFGKAVEELYGARELLIFYVASVLVAALACLTAFVATGVPIPVMGCEAPVMAVIVLYAWHHPRTQILLFFLIPIEIWIFVVGIVLLNLYNAIGSGFRGGLFIALLAAIGFALLYAKFDWRIESAVPSGMPKLRMPRRKPKLRVFEPEQRVNLDRQVDEILAKIHEQGESSLTDRERKTLQEASKRYKKT
ncbi:MAG: rhomboid family intramembrane serine protease [Planctomycetaceae bacterium]